MLRDLKANTIKNKNINIMDVLYGRKSTTTEHFSFSVNQGGALGIKTPVYNMVITVVFQDRKFKEVLHGNLLNGCIDRSTWYVLAAIAEKIKEIEENYNAPTCTK